MKKQVKFTPPPPQHRISRYMLLRVEFMKIMKGLAFSIKIGGIHTKTYSTLSNNKMSRFKSHHQKAVKNHKPTDISLNAEKFEVTE